jgi:hypothetical protein
VTTKASPDDADALGANTATTLYGVTGAGVKIGIISDSFNVLGGESADIEAGNLPAAGVTVLEEGPSGSTDEGRAMAQLIYQIAPAATLDFASGEYGMVDAIDSLVAAGCNIIVDDLTFLEEPFFQEGSDIENAVSAAVNAGVDYFTAAGNYGSDYYQASFTAIRTTLPHVRGVVEAENFGGGETLQPVAVPSGHAVQLVLEWDQPFASIGNSTGAADSLAVYVYNQSGNIVASATGDMVGSDPVQYVDSPTNTTGQTQTYDIAIVDNAGTVPGLFKYIIYDDSSPSDEILDPNAGEGSTTSVGQEVNTDVNTVGAVAYYNTPAFGATTPSLESFSSTGSSDIVLSATGSVLATPIQTSEPTFAASDGAVTSVIDPFFGTSAAAANAAGVGALVLQANTLLSTTDLTNLLRDSALAMSGTGGGSGLIQANVAVDFAETGTIAGFASGDTALYGTHLGNTIIGSTGNDTIIVAGGSNVIDGGGGTNTVDYADAPAGVSVDLAVGSAQNGFGGTDTLSNIQEVIGSAYRDTFAFGSGREVIEIQLPADQLGDMLAGFSTLDTIDLVGATFDSLVYSNGTLEALEGSIHVGLFDLAGTYATASFSIATNSGGDLITAACYAVGTRIATESGEVPIEMLAQGDRVLTHLGQTQQVRWIGYRHIDIAGHAEPDLVAPVRILAHAFGPELPHRDLILSPDHAVYVDGVLVPIKHLINGATILQIWPDSVVYYHLELARHDIIRAEGLPAETYIDTGNRSAFTHGSVLTVAYPQSSSASRGDSCAPVLTDPIQLAGLRTRLIETARSFGFRLTDDADLRLYADGKLCPPAAEQNGIYSFSLPVVCRELTLWSRLAMPTWNDPICADERRLGVAIGGMSVDGTKIALDHPALVSGFHPIEREGSSAWRWTNGRAILHLADARNLQVTTHPGCRYVQPAVSDCSFMACGNAA